VPHAFEVEDFDAATKALQERDITRADYRTHLDAGFEVILADFRLPQFDALRALELGRRPQWLTSAFTMLHWGSSIFG
jgi:hypothetical protein